MPLHKRQHRKSFAEQHASKRASIVAPENQQQAASRRPSFPSSHELHQALRIVRCRQCTQVPDRRRNLYIYQYEAYCSLECISKSLQRIVSCDHCRCHIDFHQARYSFATGTGTIRSFCADECFKKYMKDSLLCIYCSNTLPSIFYEYTDKARFCNFDCLINSSFSSPDSNDGCLNCREILTQPILNILQRPFSFKRIEYWCSFRCKLEYLKKLQINVELHGVSGRPDEVQFACVTCSEPLFDKVTKHLFGLGKLFTACGNNRCPSRFKVMSRTKRKCQVCKLGKFHSDMFEVVSGNSPNTPSHHFCSINCLQAFELGKSVEFSSSARLCPLPQKSCSQCSALIFKSNYNFCSLECNLNSTCISSPNEYDSLSKDSLG